MESPTNPVRFSYNKIRGLNALIATVTTPGTAPVIVAQRLRKGAYASPRGGKRLVADAVSTARRVLDPGTAVLVRMDSAFYGRNPVHAALAGGAAVSVTTRMDQRVKVAIASIGEDAWTTIEYTDAVFDDTSGRWISRAEVAEIDFVAFAAQPKADQVPGRLIVRRIPDVHADQHRAAGQDGLFDVWRFHAFFTTTDPQVLDTWPRTRSIVGTRSSSRSTPTSRHPRSRTCRPGCSPRTPPGSCWR